MPGTGIIKQPRFVIRRIAAGKGRSMPINRGTRIIRALLLTIVALPVLAGVARAQDERIETWEAEFFPIAITYNADLWQGRSVSSFNTNERFQVTARATNFLMQAFEEADMDADACLTAYLSSIEEVDGVSNFVEAENLPLPDGLDEGAEILVSYDFLWEGREQPVAMIQYLSCHEIKPGSLMLIGIETRAGIYEEEIEIIETILAGVEIGD
jgi:hypothetical protein